VALAFFDTNVLLYLAAESDARAGRAEDLIAEGGWISTQVLNEAARVLRFKLHHDWEATHAFLKRCELAFEIAPLDLATHRLGLYLAQRYQLAIFDSMIAAAALQSGCDTLYTEDMHHGLRVEARLEVIDPFRSPPGPH
jgi:predicted nucleic acid-binding protein